MGKLRILVPEILGSQSGEVIAASEASASLADGNLLTPLLWQKWRSASNGPADCCGYGHIAGDPDFYCNGLAMAGMNMTPGNGQMLMVTTGNGGSITLPGYEEMVPTAIAASSSILGAIGDVNEGSSPTGAGFITPTTDFSSYVIFDFGTPASSPRTGNHRQAFWFRVIADRDTTGSFAYRRPEITVSLYENVAGTPTYRTLLGTKAVHGDGGTTSHWLFFSWDAIYLATANGSNVQVKVDFSKVESGTAPRIDSLFWACESDQISGAPNYVRETGWEVITPEQSAVQGITYAPQRGSNRTRWSHKFEDVPDPINRVYFFLREDFVPLETASSLSRFLQRVPVGYVEAGRLCAGIWWEPAINRAQGQFMTITDPSPVSEDLDGGKSGSRRRPFDELKITLAMLTEAEFAFLRQRLFHDIGTQAPFYLELEPDATVELGTGGWATVISESIQVSRRNSDLYTYSLEFAVRIQR